MAFIVPRPHELLEAELANDCQLVRISISARKFAAEISLRKWFAILKALS